MAENWPEIPDADFANNNEVKKFRVEKILEAAIDLEKDRRGAAPATSPTKTMSFALEQKLHETLFTIATGAVERARSGAQFVQTAASAIGVLYTGVLAVIFVSDTPVPARGFLPTLFFALAIGLATAYLAFVNKMKAIDRPTLWGSLPEDIWQRTNFLARYTRTMVLHRAPLLRAAVVSLAIGVFLLPSAVFHIPKAATGLTEAEQAEIAWPSPPDVRPASVAVVLYQAQIDQFVKSIDESPPATGPSGEDVLATLLAVVGLLVVGFTATNQLWGDAPTDPDGDVVVPPAVQGEEGAAP